MKAASWFVRSMGGRPAFWNSRPKSRKGSWLKQHAHKVSLSEVGLRTIPREVGSRALRKQKLRTVKKRDDAKLKYANSLKSISEPTEREKNLLMNSSGDVG